MSVTSIAVIAHGEQRSGSFSNDNMTIITKAGEPLYFSEAKAYLNGQAFPEFKSSSLGDFASLSDADCAHFFSTTPGPGPGLVDTGTLVKGRQIPVYVLRGDSDISFAEMGVLAGRMKTRFIMLACRSGNGGNEESEQRDDVDQTQPFDGSPSTM